MGQALYRTHRPKKLSEVVGQEPITQTLEQALKRGRISHAYLFTGPRGVGKTSIARILAHEINGLPYNDDSSHIDIIEIDAASNRRIDEIRELREKVYVAPASAKYKVYIIDEVHMLTREAFNALLKTLEEPPAHVVFILATTDAHKLPETIISRTQRFSFRPVEPAKVAAHLKQIAKQEKVEISDEALALLAEHGEGSFRDSISLLDQAAGQGRKLEAEDIQQLLGIPPKEAIDRLLEMATKGADTASLMQAITALYDQGYQAAASAKRLGQALRVQLADGRLDRDSTLRLLGRLLEVPASHDPEAYLEIVLLENTSAPAPKKPAAASAETATDTTSEAESTPAPTEPAAAKTKADKPSPKPKPAAPAAKRPMDANVWPEVLQALKQRHNTLYGVVRMAEPDFSEADTVKLGFAFAFHQKRLSEDANREKLAAIIYELTGQHVRVEGWHDAAAKPAKPKDEPAQSPAPDNLTTISNIFGGGELLES